jgi:hypothetical protein
MVMPIGGIYRIIHLLLRFLGFLGSNFITQKATEHFVAPDTTKSSTQIDMPILYGKNYEIIYTYRVA